MAACAALAFAAMPYASAQAPAPAAAPASGVTLPGTVPALVSSSTLEGPVMAAQPVSLALVLPLRDPMGLGALIHDLYDAASPAHGQFLTPPQFADRFGPTQADYDAVTAWAQSKGLTVTGKNPSRTLLDVTGSAATVQAAFSVHLLRYLDPTGREFYAPDASPTVDSSLAGRLSGVIGLDNAEVLQPAGIGTDAQDGGLTPTDIKQAYNLSSTGLSGAGQTIALAEFSNFQQGSNNDLQVYESKFGLPNTPLNFIAVDGGATDYNDPAEVAGDLDLLVALAPGAKILSYFAPNNAQGAADTYQRIANDNQAKQVSTSWVYQENASGLLVEAENNAFEQMAAQGQTMFAASGDNGAYANGSYLSVLDPASQPYVCAVGGTTLNVNNPNTPQLSYYGETTWRGVMPTPNTLYKNQGGSGGGISQNWPIPYYQSQPSVYTSASKGSYNYRDVPDVALDADINTGYSIYFTEPNGGWVNAGGTSFAAPLWAAFTALVNQQRSQSGLKPLGLADAYLYQIGTGTLGSYAQDFHDIVTGDNLFYPAATGYDEATGWGSFNGAGLLSDLSTTPAPATVTQPFYRLINAVPGGYGYLYTTYINEAASPGSGFAYQFVDCHVYGGQNDAPGLASFYRLHDPNNGDHLMTTSASEVSSAEAYGYQLDGTVCYVFPTTSPQPSGTVPLYRAYNTSTGQHFYTKNQAEYGGLSAPPWQPEGVCAYVLF